MCCCCGRKSWNKSEIRWSTALFQCFKCNHGISCPFQWCSHCSFISILFCIIIYPLSSLKMSSFVWQSVGMELCSHIPPGMVRLPPHHGRQFCPGIPLEFESTVVWFWKPCVIPRPAFVEPSKNHYGILIGWLHKSIDHLHIPEMCCLTPNLQDHHYFLTVSWTWWWPCKTLWETSVLLTFVGESKQITWLFWQRYTGQP